MNKPKPNPYLAAETYAITHFDSAQTDSFPYAVESGTFKVKSALPFLPVLPQNIAGPINII